MLWISSAPRIHRSARNIRSAIVSIFAGRSGIRSCAAGNRRDQGGRRAMHQLRRTFAEDLAARGLAITSGLPEGSTRLRTAGRCRRASRMRFSEADSTSFYPKEIATRRLLIEMRDYLGIPAGHAPSPQNFPIRNRIIRACAGRTGSKRGIFRVAYHGPASAGIGREILRCPGNITSANSFGPTCSDPPGRQTRRGLQDVVEELPHPIREKFLRRCGSMQAAPEPKLEGAEARV